MQVFPLLIKGGVHAYTFLSNIFSSMAGPDNDPFASLLSPSLRNDIASFVSSFYYFAKSTRTPEYSLQNRFVVTLVGLNKAGFPAQHESIAIWVLDKRTLRNHEFVIERGPSKHSYTSRFSIFSQFPSSQTVFESIQRAIQNMRSLTTQEVESLTATMLTETEMIPLLPLAFDSVPAAANTPPSDTPPTTSSFTDILTTNLAKVFAMGRTASQTISPQSNADDFISGRAEGTLNPRTCIRLFKPVELSLFDVVLLGRVVHEYAPTYGLFDNQCYMFSCVIFDAIVKKYSLPSGACDLDNPLPFTSSTPVPSPTPEVGAPNNANIIFVPRPADDASGKFAPIPAEDGRWSGLLIIDPIVKQAIVNVVTSQFTLLRTTYFDKLLA